MQENNLVTIQTIRFSGLVNAIAGICVGLAYLLHPHHATPQVVASTFWFWVHVLFALSLIGGVLGATGLFAFHSKSTGLSGVFGYVFIVIALMFIFGLNFWEVFVNPVVAVESPEFVNRYGAGETIGMVKYIFPATGAVFVLGYVLLCADIIRHKTLSVSAAWITIFGVIVFGVGLSGFFSMLVVQAGSVLFAIGLITLGLSLWTRR